MKSILNGFTVEKRDVGATETIALPAGKHSLVFNNSLVSLSPAHEPTTISFDSPTTIFAIYLDTSFVNNVLEYENFLLSQQSNINDAFLLEVAEKLGTICSEDAFAEKIYAESLGVAIVEHLAKTYRASKEVYFPKGKLNPQQLKQVVDYAYSYMHFNIGLHEMAGLVHLSPYHFGRLFKQTVGKSPYQFILQLKIDCAKKMIKQNNGPISEIAYTLNFSDQSHFSNAFRKAVGVSPRQFLMAS